MMDIRVESEAREMTGAAMVVRAFVDNGVTDIFGYPGGAVLPIYDELFQQEEIRQPNSPSIPHRHRHRWRNGGSQTMAR